MAWEAGLKASQWVPSGTRRRLGPVRTSWAGLGPVRDTGADNLGIRALGTQIRPRTRQASGMETLNLEKVEVQSRAKLGSE